MAPIPFPTDRQLVTIYRVLVEPDPRVIDRADRADARARGFIDPMGVTHGGRARFFLSGLEAVVATVQEAGVERDEGRIGRVYEANIDALARAGMVVRNKARPRTP